MGERKGLIERLRKRAEDEREIQRNNEAVAEALSGQLEAFRRRDGSHNNFAVRLGLDHRSCAKKDASLAADWEEAATTIACLSEALAEAEKKRAEDWQPIETAPKGRKILAGYFNRLGNWRTVTACYYVANTLPADDDSEEYFAPEGWYECSETNEHILQLEYPPTHWRPLPAPPRDLSQGGQHG